MKKIVKNLFIIAATTILFCMISVFASADSYNGVNYKKADDHIIITGCDESVTELKVPEKIDGYPVTIINSYSFQNKTNLTSVTIPDSIVTIGELAFSNCSNLNEITISDSTKNIVGNAFNGTAFYKNADNWENDTLYIGKHLICAKNNIIFCDIKEGTLNIASKAFYECKNLKSVSIPDSVKSIGVQTFYNCSNLTTLIIPDSVTEIGIHAFNGCRRLESVELSSSIMSIQGGMFENCTSLKSIIIPNSVTLIGGSAFSNCTSLTSITIPSSVTNIDSYAFTSCTNLVSITIPNTITVINENTFKNCTSLKTINIPNSVTTIEDNAFYDCKSLETIIIPDSVTSIGSNAFCNCTSVKTITLGLGVKTIKQFAFRNCSKLSEVFWNSKIVTGITTETKIFASSGNFSIIFGDKVETVPNYALYNSNVSNVTLGKSVKLIGDSAFRYCSELTSVTIYSIPTIDSCAFDNCQKLKAVYCLNSDCLNEKDSTKHFPYGITIYGHSGTSVEKYAKNVGYLFKSIHIAEGDWISTATCLNAGQRYHICKYCGEKFDFENTPATNHTFENWTVEKVPSMEATGIKVRYCIKCNKKESITIDRVDYLIGDLDKNQVVTAADARLALRLSVSLESLSTLNIGIEIVDATLDNQITTADARKILRISASLE